MTDSSEFLSECFYDSTKIALIKPVRNNFVPLYRSQSKSESDIFGLAHRLAVPSIKFCDILLYFFQKKRNAFQLGRACVAPRLEIWREHEYEL